MKHRGADYEELKAKLTVRLLAAMTKEFPQLSDKVVFTELGTPLTNDFYLGSPHSYGLAHTPDRFRLPWLTAQTPIQGLFLTGHDVVSCGVMGATRSHYRARTSADPLII
eukprot:SAG11_NODE_1267_length_5342_cov_1.772459_6_plen_110_part_00